MSLDVPSFQTSKTNSIHNTISTLFLCFALACGLVAFSSMASAEDGKGSGSANWSPLSNLAPGGSVINLLLLSDGTVMAQSGDDGWHWFKLTPDVRGSYVNGTWTTLAPMSFPRIYFSTNVLQDGRVSLLGGDYTGTYWTPTSRLPVKSTTRSKTHGPPSHRIQTKWAVAAIAT